MTVQRIGGGDIAACAALGSAMAGATLGVVAAISLMGGGAELNDTLGLLVASMLAGTTFALFIGTPIGLAFGLMVSRFIGVSTGHAVLTGALTGIAYPLFMLMTGLLMDANGLSRVTESFLLFGVIGAVCGGASYWLVIGRKRDQT